MFTLAGSSEAVLHSLNLPASIRSVCSTIPIESESEASHTGRTEPAVKTAFELSLLASQNNFVRFFRLFPHLPPLRKCAVYPHLPTLCRLHNCTNFAHISFLTIIAGMDYRHCVVPTVLVPKLQHFHYSNGYTKCRELWCLFT